MLITQSPARPSEIRNGVSDLISGNIEAVVVCSAYVSVDGSELLTQLLSSNVVASVVDLPKTILTCFDYGITTPDALEYWLTQPNTTVLVSGAQQVLNGTLLPSKGAFHPKLYAFKLPNGRANIAVGSANLTGRGFSVNAEAVWAERGISDASLLRSLAVIQTTVVPLTPELLNRYKKLRTQLPPPAELRDEVERVQAPADPGALPWFWDAVKSGAVDPSKHSSFWVEARTLSGGSHSQLELPRGAQRFFDFAFDEYDSHENKVTIGMPRLRRGVRLWTDKILSWHGNNEMERINLPTIAQGGVAYEKTAVLFRRMASGNEFELVVESWDSDLARAWRAASIRGGQIFRVGKNTDRKVGLI